MLRIGHGYDVHALVEGRKLILGGVEIQHSKGLLGHSDADVLIHALCDALLGAAALGDIGRHFPDTDPAYAGADSRELLRRVVDLLSGFKFLNADITVIAQAPRLQPHIERMRANLVEDLNTSIDRINIKATTTEKLGYIGREEAIAAEAVVLLEQKDQLSVEELGI